MSTATLRIPQEKRDLLKIIASIEKREMQEIVSELIYEYVERNRETLCTGPSALPFPERDSIFVAFLADRQLWGISPCQVKEQNLRQSSKNIGINRKEKEAVIATERNVSFGNKHRRTAPKGCNSYHDPHQSDKKYLRFEQRLDPSGYWAGS